MILIFGSSLFQNDQQNLALQNELERSGAEFIFVNPLCLEDLKKLELVMDKGVVKLLLNGRDVSPSSLYFSRLWRSDCLIDLPNDCLYPTILRQKTEFFLQEIADCFRSSRSFPGTLERIRFAESKIAVYKIAKDCGLQVPESTIDSFSNLSRKNLYRKTLGFPFSISLNTAEKQEVAVTLTNGLDMEETELLDIPWQWQTYIKPAVHIRCVIVDKKVWVYSLDNSQLDGMSMREANESDRELRWHKTSLPHPIKASLLNLLETTGLQYSAPEFLVDSRGNYIFTDLNPCGDWCGFSSDKKETSEIAAEIITKL